MIVSPIKIQGKKTKLLPYILKEMPDLKGKLYIEPFLGSGEVLFNVNPDYALVGDNNIHIINFFKAIQEKTVDYKCVKDFLVENGEKLRISGKEYYYEMRSDFNKTHNPLAFLFLNRSCFNGVMRFNNKGDFNVPFCNKDNRFSKALITKITNQVKKIQDIILSHGKAWKFECCDWQHLENFNDFNINDTVSYFDPPYVERNSTYFDAWTEEHNAELFGYLKANNKDFILSNWLSNKYRTNEHILTYFESGFRVLQIEHFYHVGGKQANRSAVKECLVTNL